MLGSILIIVIISILGLLVTLAAAIGLIMVSILKLVYLYRTANYSENAHRIDGDIVNKAEKF